MLGARNAAGRTIVFKPFQSALGRGLQPADRAVLAHRGDEPAISGPLSRPVSASRSGWNSSRPFLPDMAFSSVVSARHGSADQSSPSATDARVSYRAAVRHG